MIKLREEKEKKESRFTYIESLVVVASVFNMMLSAYEHNWYALGGWSCSLCFYLACCNLQRLNKKLMEKK